MTKMWYSKQEQREYKIKKAQISKSLLLLGQGIMVKKGLTIMRRHLYAMHILSSMVNQWPCAALLGPLPGSLSGTLLTFL